MTQPTRRTILAGAGLIGAASALPQAALSLGRAQGGDGAAAFRTPYKYGKLVLAGTHEKGSFDERLVDCPFVFSANGRFYLTYAGWDGIGYQTGLVESRDLVNWTNRRLIMARDPHDPVTQYNVNMASMLRENELYSPGRLIKVGGRYLGAWHAYPGAGYEQGAAVIGLAWSDDLVHWERTSPILFPHDGAAWERGGLYKPYLVKNGDTYLLFYNAKTTEGSWHEQTGLATSKDLKTWTRYPGSPLIRNGSPGSWDDRFASDPAVYTHAGQWALFYFGLSTDGKARDLLALGQAPTSLFKVPEILVDAGAPGTVDDDYAHKPSLIYHDGDLYHFYCAVSGKYPNDVRGISVARSRPWPET